MKAPPPRKRYHDEKNESGEKSVAAPAITTQDLEEPENGLRNRTRTRSALQLAEHSELDNGLITAGLATRCSAAMRRRKASAQSWLHAKGSEAGRKRTSCKGSCQVACHSHRYLPYLRKAALCGGWANGL